MKAIYECDRGMNTICECFTDQVGHSNFKADEDLKSDAFFTGRRLLTFFLGVGKIGGTRSTGAEAIGCQDTEVVVCVWVEVHDGIFVFVRRFNLDFVPIFL